MSWLLALLVGAGCFIAIGESPAPSDGADLAGTDRPSTPVPAPASSSAPVEIAPAPMDAPTLDLQRKDVAATVSALPMVDRAIWITPSTLQVFLVDTGADAFAQICPLMVRYDALASSRVQLTPPAGSRAQTRFRQCRSY